MFSPKKYFNILNVYVLILFTAFPTISYSKNKTVEIIVSGSGYSYEDAKFSALRSALEQVSGTFLTSSTTIENDRITNDEINSVSNGSVLSYEIVSKTVAGSIYNITVTAVVSLQDLCSFRSKKTASNVTVNASIFMDNLALERANSEAQLKALKNILAVFKNLVSDSYDFELDVSAPQIQRKNNGVTYYNLDGTYDYDANQGDIEITATVIYTVNKNIKNARCYLKKNLKALSKQSFSTNYNDNNNNNTYTIDGESYKLNTTFYFLSPTYYRTGDRTSWQPYADIEISDGLEKYRRNSQSFTDPLGCRDDLEPIVWLSDKNKTITAHCRLNNAIIRVSRNFCDIRNFRSIDGEMFLPKKGSKGSYTFILEYPKQEFTGTKNIQINKTN